jgi:protein TonB
MDNNTAYKRRLARWLLLSLLAHLIFLAWLLPGTPSIPMFNAAPVLQLRLLDDHASASNTPAEQLQSPQLQTAPKAPQQESIQSLPQPTQAPMDIVPSEPETFEQKNWPIASASMEKGQAREAAGETNSLPQEEYLLLALLNEELSRHFFYPPLAVRRGQQGTVALGFEIDRQGQINNIHVAQSSGHAILDRAAMQALIRVGKLSSRPQQPHSMQLPVSYRLAEG